MPRKAKPRTKQPYCIYMSIKLHEKAIAWGKSNKMKVNAVYQLALEELLGIDADCSQINTDKGNKSPASRPPSFNAGRELSLADLKI